MIRKRSDLKWKFDLKSKLWNPKSPLLPPHYSELLRFPECPAFDLKNDDKNQFMWTNQKNCKWSFQNTFNRNTKNKYIVQIWHWLHLVAEIHHGPKIPGNNSFNAYFLLWQVFLTPYDMIWLYLYLLLLLLTYGSTGSNLSGSQKASFSSVTWCWRFSFLNL